MIKSEALLINHIQSQNWYKPLLGVPYRPFFGFPDRIRQEIPFFKYCNAFGFTVFDPPRALTPALVLAPDITISEPKSPSKTPEPSAVGDPGPKKTATAEDPASAFTPTVDPHPIPQPKQTANSPDADPANSQSPTPAENNHLLPDPNVQQPTESGDPAYSKSPTPAGKSPVLPDPKAQQPAQSADPSSTSPKAANPNPADHPDAPPQGQGSLQTTIQLRPQSNDGPTTVFIGSKPDAGKSTTSIGALILNAIGKLDPSAKPDAASDPKVSNAVPAVSFPTVKVAGQLLTISDPSSVSIAGTVLTPGGADVTVAGTPVSLAPSGNLVVGTGPSNPSSTVLAIAGHTITANPTSFQIAGTPVKAGAPAVTISGTPISIDLSGNLVIGGNGPLMSPPAAVFTVGAQRFTAHGTDLVGSDTTVRAGDPAVLIAGTSASLGSSGVLVLGSSTTTLAGLPSSASIYTVGDETFTANPTQFSVAGTTLSAGGPGVVVSSTSISLNPSGSLIVGTSTIPLPTPTPAVVATDGQVYTIESDGQVAVDGVTLSSGGPGTTISGTPMSVGSGGFIIGTSTIPLQNPTPTVITTDGQVFTIKPSGLIAIDGVTLSSGGLGTTISGTALSVGSAGFIVGTQTIPLTSPIPSIITTDGQIFTMEPNGAIHVDGATLSNGGSGTTINGTPMRVNSGGLVIGSDTISLPTTNASVSGLPITQFTGAASKTVDLSRLSLLLCALGTWIALWNVNDRT